MNKSHKRIIILGIASLFSLWQTFAQPWGRSIYGSEPIQILDSVASEANDEYRIQETQLDDISPLQWSYASQYRLTNTLDSMRQNIWPYINRAYYIGLAAAVLLLVFNGFLMVTNSLHGKGDLWESKKRLVNIVLWVIVLTGIYAIVRIFMSLIGRILW